MLTYYLVEHNEHHHVDVFLNDVIDRVFNVPASASACEAICNPKLLLEVETLCKSAKFCDLCNTSPDKLFNLEVKLEGVTALSFEVVSDEEAILIKPVLAVVAIREFNPAGVTTLDESVPVCVSVLVANSTIPL